MLRLQLQYLILQGFSFHNTLFRKEVSYFFSTSVSYYQDARNVIHSRCLPVSRPPIGVLTPDALLTAVRENDPAFGKERTNELKMLQNPNAKNS